MMKTSSIIELRKRLEPCFSRDTAAPGTVFSVPSAGHCAIVSIIAHKLLWVDIVSATVCGQSHWFNRGAMDEGCIDFDITGDQFGFPSICINSPGKLYSGTRLRSMSEANEETVFRARLLAERSGLLLNI